MLSAMAMVLRAASLGLVFSGYLALAATPRFPMAILALPLFFTVLMPLGEWLDRSFPRYRDITFAMTLVYFVLGLGAWVLFRIDLLGAVINLIIFVQAHSMLHRKRPRNYHYLHLMAFFLLLSASVLDPEPEIGLVLFLFLACGAVTFTALHLHAELERAPKLASACVLALDEREISVTAQPPRIGLSLAAAIALIVLVSSLLTGAAFIAMPRMEAGVLGRSSPSFFRTGVSQTVDVAQGGTIAQDYTTVMRVEFPDEAGGCYNGPMFWRCTTLDEYRGPAWARRGIIPEDGEPTLGLRSRDILAARIGELDRLHRGQAGKPRIVHQRIYMNEVPAQGVPCLTLVEHVELDRSTRNAILAWDRFGDHTITFTSGSQRWLEYEAWSDVTLHTPDTLRAAPDAYGDVLSPRNYFHLTAHNLQPRTLRLAARITENKSTVYDKVAAIAGYLNSGQFTYTLSVPSLPPDFAIDTFIHDVRMGHCELFATAMALMVRSLGIPARVVSGYRGGEWNPGERAYIVRANMAHLWVEVYFLGIGWVTFDPSPRDMPAPAFGVTRLARFLSQYSFKAKMRWYRDVVAFDRGFQVQALRNIRLGVVSFGDTLLDWNTGPSKLRAGEYAVPVVALALLAATVLASGLRRRIVRRTRLPLNPDQLRAVRAYRRLRRKLERARVPCRGRTAEEIQALLEPCGTHADPARDVLRTYNTVRFGGRPLPPEDYAKLQERIRVLRLPAG